MSSDSSPTYPDKPQIVYLLAVWGESFIKTFFEFSLRSLLSRGNIPALSEEYDSHFIFLTTSSDIPFFNKQLAFDQLSAYCSVDFIEIKDLIFEKNYSATLTLAYERGIRSRGSYMLNTYFFFLVSDYIMADGSLNNLKHYLKDGYNGITSGNFLVVEEYISEKLKKIRDVDPQGMITIEARQLLKLAFPYIHPVSIAQTVTNQFTYATHANRLFWRVDDQTIIGRFYLRHMLCIRPETEDFQLGSSCDYSFIPEMCPSGKVAHIQDSDEYCVIEMAPYNYEKNFISAGSFNIDKLAEQLCEWTTEVHRKNASIPTIYHSKELVEPPFKAIQESREFIEAVDKKLSPFPQPIRGHFYWTSCIESIFYSILMQKDRSRYYFNGMFAGILGAPSFSHLWNEGADDRSLLKITHPPSTIPVNKKGIKKARLKRLLSGESPNNSVWHLEWHDDYKLKKDLQKKIEQYGYCVFIVFEPVRNLINWLESRFPQKCSYQFYEFFMLKKHEELKTLFQKAQHAVIFLRTDDVFCELGSVIRQCEHYLPAESLITIYLKHKHAFTNKTFKKNLAICLADLSFTKIVCENIIVHCSLPRLSFSDLHARCCHKLFSPNKKILSRLIGLCGLCVLNVMCLLGNLLGLLGFKFKKRSTSAFVDIKCSDKKKNS